MLQGFVRRFILLTAVMLVSGLLVSPVSFGAGEEFLYFPQVLNPDNLQITGFEISQAVQDPQNSVPLVANRPTLLRIFTATGNGQPQQDATITVTAYRSGVFIGSRSVGPQTASPSSSRSDLTSTFNLLLPANWLSGNVVLRASAGSGSEAQLAASFLTVPDLNLRIVPIRYTHQPTGQIYTTPYVDTISDWMMRTYPVANINVTFRNTPYLFSGDLRSGSSWNALLEQTKDLLFEERTSTGQVFYGLIPAEWFRGGIAGYGYIGLRASIGLNLVGGFWGEDVAGELAAHEIGHNFGRYHVDCGGPGGVDYNYPYDPATIGQHGIDGIGAASLELILPAGAADFMSYCDDLWVSDYTYEALLAEQLDMGSRLLAEPEPHFLLSGRLQEDGLLLLDPTYPLSVIPEELPDSPYEVELRDASGGLLGRYPVGLLTAEEEGVSGSWVLAFLPVPDTAVASLTVRDSRTQRIAAEKIFLPLSADQQQLRFELQQTGTTAHLEWGLPNHPALVRYSHDGGESWLVLKMDHLGGRATIDLEQLPGGDAPLFELLLADTGTPLRLQRTLSTPLPNQEPLVWITGPDHIRQGEAVTLQAQGSDAEDGPLTNLVWAVNGERVLTEIPGQKWLSLQNLPVGFHQIRLQGTDSRGVTATAHFELQVLER